MDTKIKINKTTIAISNSEKIFFPKSKITKGDLIDYYSRIAPHIIFHVKNHPLTMQRFPEGIQGEAFYQKNASKYFPSWIQTIGIKKEEGTQVEYVVGNTPATYAYLANQGCVTLHAWLSRIDKLEYPDRMIFDLDPSTHDFTSVKKAALLLKDKLDAVNAPSFAMTTGSRGMHVMVPLKRVHTFDEVAQFAYAIAQDMVQESPEKYTLELRKNKRGKKIFIDTLRNRWSATSVVPYAVRPHEKAPVATPLAWDELSDKKLSSQTFTIATIFARLASEKDPWQHAYEHAVSLKKPFRLLMHNKEEEE